MIGIYKITNLINGKSYVGQSIHIERRWQEHKLPSADSAIAKAIQRYGVNNFSFEVLEELQPNELDEKEKYYIKKFNTIVPNGYNITDNTNSQNTTFANFDKEIYYQIVKDIQNIALSFDDIAKKYNVCRRTITRINNGYSHKLDNIEYPIRKTKTISEEYFCVDCGKKISKKATRCDVCVKIFSRTTIRPSREELKFLIRTQPMIRIGEKYKVSDNTIRKWCESYNLPKKVSEIKKYSDSDWELI